MLNKIYYWLYRLTSNPEEKGHHSSGYWQGKIRSAVVSSCMMNKGKILEIGCGEGLLLIKLAEQNTEAVVLGIDNDSAYLNTTSKGVEEKQLQNVRLSMQNAFHLALRDGYFDVVICVNFFLMLDSIDSVKQILTQLNRVCKTSGRIIFEFRNSRNLFFVLKYALAKYYDSTIKNQHLNTYHPKQIEPILKNLNLKVIDKKYIGFYLKQFAPIIIIEAEKTC